MITVGQVRTGDEFVFYKDRKNKSCKIWLNNGLLYLYSILETCGRKTSKLDQGYVHSTVYKEIDYLHITE